MKHIVEIVGVLLALSLLVAACGPAAGSGGETLEGTPGNLDSNADAAAFSREALQNAEYQTGLLPEGTVRLASGEYRAAAAPGSASEIAIALTEYVATGELDGQPAAAAILTSSGGGSGTFYELHVLVEEDGALRDVAWTQLGDRVQINSLSIENDEIVVDMVAHGPDDPMCCPTQQVVQTYTLQGAELVLSE